MKFVKIKDLKFTNKVFVNDYDYVCFCEEFKEYILVISIPWIMQYSRYYWISKEGYELAKVASNAFVEKYKEAFDSVMELPKGITFMGADALRDYDGRKNFHVLIDKKYPDVHCFQSFLYEDRVLYAHILMNGIHYAVLPYRIVKDENDEYIRPLENNDNVEMISIESDGQSFPIFMGIRIENFEGFEDWKSDFDGCQGKNKEKNKVKNHAKETLENYIKEAEQGNAEAQYKLGWCYDTGIFVKKMNFEEAVKWYRKSAEQGHAEAQASLASCYRYGNGVEKNLEEAVKWYRKSAEQGDKYAQYSLANCYRDGEGVEKDLEEAVKWYRKSAEQGNKYAQYSLANCYRYGNGVEENLEEAVKWYRKSAELGDASAQCNLADSYRDGKGVEKNLEEAVKWYKKAAKQGEKDAKYNLANCYRYGKGVEKNPKEAVKLYKELVDKGYSLAVYRVS